MQLAFLSFSFTVPGLLPHVEYELCVSAVNKQGEGEKSEAIQLRTDEAGVYLHILCYIAIMISCVLLNEENLGFFIF